MSFILDALRKSEAARRRNEAPDLFAAMPGDAATPRERPAWPMWLVGGIGVAALATSLWLLAHRAPEAMPAATPTAERLPADTATPPAAPSAASMPASMPASTTPGKMPPMPGPRPDAQANIGPAPVPNGAPIGTSPATTTRPATASTAVAATSAPSAATPSAPAPTTPAPSASAPLTAAPSTTNDEIAVAPPAAPSSARNVLRLSDLDPGTRKSLPPLKMSMHMWNDDSARRFVILDGHRLGEGDMLGDVTIESITRDGVIVNWQGSRLRVDMR